MTQCPNCNQQVVEKWNFCKSCGQRLELPSLKGLLQEIVEAFTFEKGYLKTTLHLLFLPRRFYDRFFGGQSAKYTNPIAFLLITSGLKIVQWSWIEWKYYGGVSTMSSFSSDNISFGILLIMILAFIAVFGYAFRKQRNIAAVSYFSIYLFSLFQFISIFITSYHFFRYADNFVFQSVYGWIEKAISITFIVMIIPHIFIFFKAKWYKILLAFLAFMTIIGLVSQLFIYLKILA